MSIITSFSCRKFYGLFNSTERQHFIKIDRSFLYVSNWYPVTRHWAMNQHLIFIVWNSRGKAQICLSFKENPSLPLLLIKLYRNGFARKVWNENTSKSGGTILKHMKAENIFKWLCCYLYLVITKWMLAFSCSKYWALVNRETQKIRFL